MPELNVQQKVIAFVQQNPQYEGKSAESVLSAMLASGEITQTEIDGLKTNNTKSAFGFGFETDYPLDLSFEKTHYERGEISTTPTTQTQKRTTDLVQSRYKKAQSDFDKQMLEDGWAGDVADKFSVVWGSDNRAKKVREDLKIASLQAEQLKIAAEESSDAFKAKFKEIYGIDYNAQNIEAFERDEKAYLEALDAKNREDAFNQHFDKLLNEDLADEFKTVGGGNSGATQTVRISKEEIYEQEFKKLVEMFGENGEEILNEYIKQAQEEDFATDGFSAVTGTIEYKWNLLKKLVQGMSDRFATETAKACNGSDIESLEKRYENSYISAFGNNNDIQKRVNDYNISQQKGAGTVKMVALSVAMLAISIATMGTGSASVPAVVGAAGATGAGATSAAASGGVLVGIAKSAITVASLSAGIEISDRFTSGAALKSLREEGFLEYLETASEMTNWSQVAKASLSAGAMCVVFGGVSYAVSNLTRVAGTALKMSELGIAYASAAATSASTVATGLGVEYLMTGEISVEGVIFTVTMAVIGGVTQVMQIKRAAPQFEQMREQLKTDGEYALKILDFQPGEEVTLETIKAHTAERAVKYVSSSNSTPEKQYMQLFSIQASHDLLTTNIVEIQNLLKTGGINLAVAQQNFTYKYSPSTTQTYSQITAPQMGLTTPQTSAPLAMPEVPSIATQTGISTVGQAPQPAIAGLGFGIAQNSAPEYVPPQVSTVEVTSQADLCVSEGAPSSNSIGFIDRIKSFFGIEKTAPVSESSTQTIAPRVFAPEKGGKTIIKDYPAYEHFDPDNCKFTSKAKPVVLKRSHPSPNEKVLHISNFDDPGGTIAISTTLDQAISTDKMLQCAGIAIVDKSQNVQTLVHCYPDAINSNRQILEHIFSHSDSKNLEIFIVPGSSYSTDQTVNFLLETSKELAGDAKITLCNLPRRNSLAEPSDNTVAFGKEAVVLKNGELTCCEANDLVNKIVNPEGKIICTNTYDNKLAATVVVPKATPSVKQTSEKIATVPEADLCATPVAESISSTQSLFQRIKSAFRKNDTVSSTNEQTTKMPLSDEVSKKGGQAFVTKKIISKLSGKKYQKEASVYLDELLTMTVDSPSTKDNYVLAQKYYLLKDGTMIARMNGTGAETLFDELNWPTEYKKFNTDLFAFEVIEPNGTTHTLIASTPENCAKAQKIFDYMQTLEPLEGNIFKIQKEYVENLDKSGSTNEQSSVATESVTSVTNTSVESAPKTIGQRIKEIQIPYRLSSSMSEELGGNHGLRRILLTLMESGKTDLEILREIYPDYDSYAEDYKMTIQEEWQGFKNKILKIDRSFNNIIPNLVPMKYYRGITGDIETNTGLQIFRDAKVGDIIEPDAGYPMASLEKSTAEVYSNSDSSNPDENVFITIKTPVGAQVSRDYGLGGISESPHAYVIFRRAAKYKVLEKTVKDNKTYITLEYLGGK